MDILSDSQKRYIMNIYKLSLTGATLTDIAVEMNVSKATVHGMLETLTKSEYIKKLENGEFILAKKGIDFTNYFELEQFVLNYLFAGHLGINEKTAEINLSEVYGVFSKEFITLAYNKIKSMEDINFNNNNIYQDSIYRIPKGKYKVPFKVIRNSDKKTSMGNKGFNHPCCVSVKEESGVVVLTAKQIYYKSIIGKQFKGKLSNLCYWDGTKYVMVKEDDDEYIIPLSAVSCKRNAFGKIILGIINIKAKATVGVLNMPESEAKIFLNFAAKSEITA